MIHQAPASCVALPGRELRIETFWNHGTAMTWTIHQRLSRLAIRWATLLAVVASPVLAQSSCSTTLTPTNSIKPSVASGYQAALVATGLTKPRSIQFDSSGNLLVVEAGKGISSHQLQDDGGICVSVKSSKDVVGGAGGVGVCEFLIPWVTTPADFHMNTAQSRHSFITGWPDFVRLGP